MSPFRRSVFLIYATALLQGAFGVMLASSSPILRHRLHLGDVPYGAVFLMLFATAFAASIIGTHALRRLSLRSVFRYGLMAEILSLGALGLAGILPLALALAALLLGVVLAGAGMGAMGISLNTAAIDLFPQSRGGALSALHGILGAGAAVWPMLVAAAIDREVWALAPFLLGAGFAVLLAGMTNRPMRGLTDVIIREHARTDLPPRLRWWTLTAGLYGVGESIFTVWAVVLLFERRHLPLPVAAGALSIFWVTMTGGRLLAAALVRKIPAVPLALGLAGGMTGSYFLVASSSGAGGSLFAYATAGLCCSALFPLLFSLASHEYPERTPQVSAFFSAAVLLGLAVGSFGVGPLRGPLGLERVYLLAAAIPLFVAAVLARLDWRAPRREVSGQN